MPTSPDLSAFTLATAAQVSVRDGDLLFAVASHLSDQVPCSPPTDFTSCSDPLNLLAAVSSKSARMKEPYDQPSASQSGSESTHDESPPPITIAVEARRQQRFISTRGWTLEGLLASGKKFVPVTVIPASSSPQVLAQRIQAHEQFGEPLIISGWHELPCWPKGLFSIDGLLQHSEKQDIKVRNCLNWQDKDMSLDEFVRMSRIVSPFIEDKDTERLYGKDIDCPKKWEEWLHQGHLPDELLPNGTNNLLQYIPSTETVETLMCYLGIGDTFTPAHKDLCASSGQNLMCYTENGGSSFWFMTESSAAPDAAEYFQNELQCDLDEESRVVKVEELAKAPFKVYVAEQKMGDLMLVPKRSCHQVVNNGGLTVKTSWSRITVEGLVTAFHHELPIYRRVCRPETYKVKAACYHAMRHYTTRLKALRDGINPCEEPTSASPLPSPPASPAIKKSMTAASTSYKKGRKNGARDTQANLYLPIMDLRKLMNLFDKILREEYPGSEWEDKRSAIACALPSSLSEQGSEDMSNLSCDFCGSDIFLSCFECKDCESRTISNNCLNTTQLEPDIGASPSNDACIVCPGCYVEGRTCPCGSMQPAFCRSYQILIDERNKAAQVINSIRSRGCNRPFEISPQLLRTIEHPPFFEGGCLFWRMKNSKPPRQRDTRPCGTHPLHHVQWFASLNCKECHRPRCYKHLLSCGIHSSEALVKHNKDTSQKQWHVYHKKARLNFKRKRAETLAAERTGEPLHCHTTYVLAAERFRTCHPLRIGMSVGWYDEQYFAEDPDLFPISDHSSYAATLSDGDSLSSASEGSLSAIAHLFDSVSELSSLTSSDSDTEKPSVAEARVCNEEPNHGLQQRDEPVCSTLSSGSSAVGDLSPMASTHEDKNQDEVRTLRLNKDFDCVEIPPCEWLAVYKHQQAQKTENAKAGSSRLLQKAIPSVPKSGPGSGIVKKAAKSMPVGPPGQQRKYLLRPRTRTSSSSSSPSPSSPPAISLSQNVAGHPLAATMSLRPGKERALLPTAVVERSNTLVKRSSATDHADGPLVKRRRLQEQAKPRSTLPRSKKQRPVQAKNDQRDRIVQSSASPLPPPPLTRLRRRSTPQRIHVGGTTGPSSSKRQAGASKASDPKHCMPYQRPTNLVSTPPSAESVSAESSTSLPLTRQDHAIVKSLLLRATQLLEPKDGNPVPPLEFDEERNTFLSAQPSQSRVGEESAQIQALQLQVKRLEKEVSQLNNQVTELQSTLDTQNKRYQDWTTAQEHHLQEKEKLRDQRLDMMIQRFTLGMVNPACNEQWKAPNGGQNRRGHPGSYEVCSEHAMDLNQRLGRQIGPPFTLDTNRYPQQSSRHNPPSQAAQRAHEMDSTSSDAIVLVDNVFHCSSKNTESASSQRRSQEGPKKWRAMWDKRPQDIVGQEHINEGGGVAIDQERITNRVLVRSAIKENSPIPVEVYTPVVSSSIRQGVLVKPMASADRLEEMQGEQSSEGPKRPQNRTDYSSLPRRTTRSSDSGNASSTGLSETIIEKLLGAEHQPQSLDPQASPILKRPVQLTEWAARRSKPTLITDQHD